MRVVMMDIWPLFLGLAYKIKRCQKTYQNKCFYLFFNLVKKSLMEHHQLFVPVFLKNTNVKGIYGLHMFPDVDAGKNCLS